MKPIWEKQENILAAACSGPVHTQQLSSAVQHKADVRGRRG